MDTHQRYGPPTAPSAALHQGLIKIARRCAGVLDSRCPRENAWVTAVDKPRVLVVDDERVLAGVVANYLDRSGFDVRICGDGAEAVGAVRDWLPSVVLLDLGLPGLDGVEVCRRIREFSDCYVLMLTARDDEDDKLRGLEVGADDYVTKPFSVREVVARVDAMLRRPRTGVRQRQRVFGELVVDPEAREARLEGRVLGLTRTEFDLLLVLSARPGTAFSRQALLDEVWGEGWVGDSHVVDVHIGNLRKKLEEPAAPRFVQTVRGVEYKMGDGA